MVAERDGVLVGHIILTATAIVGVTDDNPVLLLAEIAVAAEDRKQGIVTQLIENAFERARQRGYHAAILVGDRAFYGRFGFSQWSNFGVRNANGIEDQFVQFTELKQHALSGVAGTILLPE